MSRIALVSGMLLLGFLLAGSAAAADLFVRKGPPPVQTESPPVPAQAPAEPAPVKPVMAPATSVAEYTTRYYMDCAAKEDTVLKGPNLQFQCACASQKVAEQMTLDEINSMA